MLLLPNTPLEQNRAYHGFFDDFDHLVTTDLWTLIKADTNTTLAVADGVNGIVTMGGADDDDEDERYLHTTFETFKMADNKPIVVEARIQFAEVATNKANVIFGLMDGVAANALQDAGAGPKSSYNGAVFFKVDGETLWRTESSILTTQTTSETRYTAGQASFQTLRIVINNVSATKMRVQFFIDQTGRGDFELCQESGKRRNSIDHEITLGTAVDMDVFVGSKNGSTADEITLLDYISAYQLR